MYDRASQPHSVDLSQQRILIVDDEREIRDMLERHLRYEGLETRTASNGTEALQILQGWPASVVATDITMPRMNGLKLLERIRSEYPGTRVVVMTGRTNEESILASMRGGADACVLKPLVDLQEFVRAIRHSLAILAHWDSILSTVRERAKHIEGLPTLNTKAS